MSWRPCVVGLVVAFAASTASCASSHGSAATMHGMDAERSIPRRDILFAIDLVPARADNVYEAILEVRPSFLSRRASSMDGTDLPLRVFVDDLELSGLDALRGVPLGPVTSVRYVDPSDTNFRWGPGRAPGPAGAIMVTTAR
jgi:hypothetical protein